MNRRSIDRKGSHKAFKGRVSKTHRLNLANPLRGGIRL